MNTKLTLCFLFCLALTGCKSFQERVYKDYAVEDISFSAESPYLELVDEIKKQNPKLIADACFNIPIPAGTNNCKEQRNLVMSAIIYNSEKLCVQHRKTIYGNEATWNITSGTFTNIFSGAATVMTPTSTKSIFSALALFSNSQRSLINETVYKQILIEAVDTKIVQQREKLALDIYNNFDENINQYPVSRALHDVVAFHYSCSFMDGLRLALLEGTQERPHQKLTRLKNNLKSIELETKNLENEKANYTTAGKAVPTSLTKQLAKLEDRYEALSNEIISIEKQ